MNEIVMNLLRNRKKIKGLSPLPGIEPRPPSYQPSMLTTTPMGHFNFLELEFQSALSRHSTEVMYFYYLSICSGFCSSLVFHNSAKTKNFKWKISLQANESSSWKINFWGIQQLNAISSQRPLTAKHIQQLKVSSS